MIIDLFEILKEEGGWYNIDIQTLQDLVHSMPERCALVIKNPMDIYIQQDISYICQLHKYMGDFKKNINK